jgi:tetratricopeptide (TPR) repeat protein
MVLRLLGSLLALLCLAAGAFGLGASRFPESGLVATGQALLATLCGPLTALAGSGLSAASIERGLAGLPAIGLLGAGLALLLISVRRGVALVAEEEAKAEEDPDEAPIGGRLARQARKQAALLAKKGRLKEAAEFCMSSGLLDQAAEYFERAEELVRAAEVRHHQKRFTEAAELYIRTGQHETAGTIFASANEFARSADSYLKAGRVSVAAEMYEKAGDFVQAGRCYSQCEFHRHAAQVFLKAEEWGQAAKALEQVILEEGIRVGSGQDPAKEKELRKLVLQAGKLHERAGDLEAAERILEKGGCFSAAAELALRLEHLSKASDLFLRAGDPVKAADALRRVGEAQAAAQILGDYHRDRGDDEEAARLLVEAGDFVAAGDLYRKLEQLDKAGECYEQHGDVAQAAEMFHVGGDFARAASNYERIGRFGEAAECCAQMNDFRRQAANLARANRMFEAGQILHREGMEEEAIKLLQQVKAGDPGFAAASSLLGDIFCSRGKHTLAIKKLRQAIGDRDLDTDNRDAYYRLASAHEAAEEFQEAVDLYEKILSFDYHYKDVEKRLEIVRPKVRQDRPAEAPAATQQGMAPPSARSGRYRIDGELGRGGMGIVYKAHDTVLDRPVALKVLPDALKDNPEALKNFLREAKSAAKLNHPNIVTVYDAGEQDGRYYIAMEYVDGTTLKEIIRRRGAIAPNGVIHVLLQMCEALSFAHDQKVVHRDVKTANTMWTRDKKAKIMDFGLAKVIEEVRNHTTMVSGTPYYMSPEQTLGKNVDHRTDIYSLGVTLFELATGSLPFQEGNVPYHHVHTPPPDPREANPNLPEFLAEIIIACLKKNPDERFQSAAEIAARVKAALSKSSNQSRG